MSDWTKWDGGENPVPVGVMVEVKLRDGSTQPARLSRMWAWAHISGGSDIVEYRVVSEQPKTLALSDRGQMNVQTTLNERKNTHGDFTKQACLAQNLKEELRGNATGHGMWPKLDLDQREALDMICGKISRILHGNPNEPDHWRDIAGYATLVENRLVHGKSHLG